MTKSVLIVSFSMPPSPDIGGRRWVKFAKNLKKNGHLVKILAAQEDLPGISPWISDVDALKNDIQFINSSYPKYLGINPRTFLEKILYRASLHYTKLRHRGNYYDKSNHWEKRLLKACRQIVSEYGIHNLICTIPPFRSAHTLLNLKKEFPKLNMIVDYRDPWTSNKTAFGFTGLPAHRFDFEKALEEQVVKSYDHIIAVSNEMGIYFKNFIPETQLEKKFTAIPNGFDHDDFSSFSLQQGSLKNQEQIKIVFGGTFYDKSMHVFEKLVEAVDAAEKQFPEKKGCLQFIFIGSVPDALRKLIDKRSHAFSFLGRKSLAETYAILAEADFCSLFLTDDLNYSLSTKFYEYLALKKPILCFSKQKGATAEFVELNNIGKGINFISIKKDIQDLLQNKFKLDFNPRIDIEAFSVSQLTRKVETLLID